MGLLLQHGPHTREPPCAIAAASTRGAQATACLELVPASLAAPQWPRPFLRLCPSMPLSSLMRYGATKLQLRGLQACRQPLPQPGCSEAIALPAAWSLHRC